MLAQTASAEQRVSVAGSDELDHAVGAIECNRRVGFRVWLVLLAIMLLAVAVRARLLDVPLERDEGEYAYAAQLMLHGIAPYQQLYSMKFPGVSTVYAAFLLMFGETQRSVHLGLLLVNAATILLVFRLARRWGGDVAGLVAAACFALLSVGRPTQGLFANAEHFVVLLGVAGWLLLPDALESGRGRRLVVGGVLLGLGVLMKQHGAMFAAGGLAYVFFADGRPPWRALRVRCLRSTWLAAGMALPLILAALVLYLGGSFERFWFWTVLYAQKYAAEVTATEAIALFKMSASDIVGSMPLIWLLAGMGLVALVWDQCFRAARWFLGLFVLSAFLAVIPGFFFRPHYFLLVLPAVSTLAGLGVGSLTHWPLGRSREPVRIGIAAAIAMLCLAISFHQNRGYLLEMTPAEVSRATFGLNAFPESILIADFIRQRTVESDRIAILGSEPQIYFYARRRAATGYVYMYEMMRPHDYAARMQAEMALEIERVRPKLLLYVRIEDSWSREKGSGNYIFEWFDAYWKERYEPVGLVAMTPEWTEYHWDPDVPWPPATHLWVAIFERKD